MKKRLRSLWLVFLVVVSLFAIAENEPSSGPQSGYCAGFWGSLKCYLFGDAENRAGRSWFDRENVVGFADYYSNQITVDEGEDGRYEYRFVVPAGSDQTRIGRWERQGNDLSWSAVPEQTVNILRSQLPESVETQVYASAGVSSPPPTPSPSPAPAAAGGSGSTPAPSTAGSSPSESSSTPASATPPAAPTSPPPDSESNSPTYRITGDTNYEYRPVNGHLETRRAGSSDLWVSAETCPGCNAELARNTFETEHPGVLAASSTPTGSQAPPVAAPPLTATSPEQLRSALARTAAVDATEQAQADIQAGRITHRQAYLRLRQLADERTTSQPTLENINTAPVGSQVMINGVRYRKVADNSWRTSTGTTATDSDLWSRSATDLISEDNLELVREFRQHANTVAWQGSWAEVLGSDAYLALAQGKWVGGEVIGTTFGAIKQLGQYQALSNALFGAEVSRNWFIINADNELLNRWSDLPAFASRELCDYDDARRSQSPGQSTTFIHTVGGSYQFVGSIQAEKSLQKSPVLCRRNTDPDAEQEWICSKRQVCAIDNLCYPDTNEDGTPDSPDPVSGYFYKITWGVTAPTDEKFTPYIDENGKAIKFNLQLTGDQSVWIYQRPGTDPRAVIALNNGQNDQDVIVHYSPHQFTQACIRYDDRSRAKDSDGNLVGDQCVSFVESERGQTEYGRSDRTTPSITTSSPEISRSSEW